MFFKLDLKFSVFIDLFFFPLYKELNLEPPPFPPHATLGRLHVQQSACVQFKQLSSLISFQHANLRRK